MSDIEKSNNTNKLPFLLFGIIFCLGLGGLTSTLQAQIGPNGTFDPSKVIVAKEKSLQVQSFQQTIEAANEFNRTLGTPAHPRPGLPSPTVEATKVVSSPTASSTPSEGRIAPPSAPGSSPGPPSSDSSEVPEFLPDSNQGRSGGLFGFLRRSSRSEPSISMNSSPAGPRKGRRSSSAGRNSSGSNSGGGSSLPSESPSLNYTDIASELESIASREGASPEEIGRDIRKLAEIMKEMQLNNAYDYANPGEEIDESEYITAGGIVLPSHGSSPDGSGSKRKFGRKKKLYDVPRGAIPILASSGGSRYTDSTFKPGPNYAPLLDAGMGAGSTGTDPGGVRDMTDPGVLPIPNGGRSGSQPNRIATGTGPPTAPTNNFYIVKRNGLEFFPFMFGTETPDPDYSFNLHQGAVVRDYGSLGKKRMIQIDSGEKGIVTMDGLRGLSVSEGAILKNGLTRGEPWYSILDTEPEIE